MVKPPLHSLSIECTGEKQGRSSSSPGSTLPRHTIFEETRVEEQERSPSSPWSRILSLAYLQGGAYGWVVRAIHLFSSRSARLPKTVADAKNVSTFWWSESSQHQCFQTNAYFMKMKLDMPDPMCLPPANLPHRRSPRQTNRELLYHQTSVGPATTESVQQHRSHKLQPALTPFNLQQPEGTLWERLHSSISYSQSTKIKDEVQTRTRKLTKHER